MWVEEERGDPVSGSRIEWVKVKEETWCAREREELEAARLESPR